MLVEDMTTEYLIIHEDEIDWDQLSSDKERDFSLAEIRMFRKRIKWEKYLISHSNTLSENKLEVASKHFTKEIYNILSAFNIAPEEFIVKHVDKFDMRSVIRNSKISEDALLQTQNNWMNIEGIRKDFNESKYIDINDPNYSRVKLILETL